MKRLLLSIPIAVLLSAPVYAQDERLDALDFWAVENYDDANKACEFYATYHDYEYVLEDISEDEWNNIDDALSFYEENKDKEYTTTNNATVAAPLWMKIFAFVGIMESLALIIWAIKYFWS